MDNYIKVIIYEIRCKNRNRVQYTIYNTVFVDSSPHILNSRCWGRYTYGIGYTYSAYTMYIL